jgi:hypothetical protein
MLAYFHMKICMTFTVRLYGGGFSGLKMLFWPDLGFLEMITTAG